MTEFLNILKLKKMKKQFLMIIAFILMSNLLYSQTFSKEEKEVFYKEYMKEMGPNIDLEQKEEYCYYFFRELYKIDRKEYDNMLDFEKRILLKKLKKSAREMYEYNIWGEMAKLKANQERMMEPINELRRKDEEERKKKDK